MSNQPGRISSGGQINRSKSLNFRFNGKTYSGYEGDTLASALIANGVRLIGRSFKYHRPRGIFTSNSHEPSALVELRTGARHEPNIPATTIELYDGLVAKSQNCWPSLKYDILSVNQLFSSLLVAGFYYKVFKWPVKFWTNVYEPIIRRSAGLGTASNQIDPDRYEKTYAHCDVLVIGSGAAGLRAAEVAGSSGAQVILCDEAAQVGGTLCSTPNGPQVIKEELNILTKMANVKILPRTTVFGWYDTGTFAAVERISDHLLKPEPFKPRQKLWRIVAKQTVLATGSHERPLVFPNNDRPGVMLTSAVRTYINQYAVKPGKRAVLFTNNDSIIGTISDLEVAGIEVAAVVDVRSTSKIKTNTLLAGYVISTVLGKHRVTGVEVKSRSGGGDITTIDCDLVCVSGGWNPAIQLPAQRGMNPVWNEEVLSYLPRQVEGDNFICAGSINGLRSTKACQQDGTQAGQIAAQKAGFRTENPIRIGKVKDSKVITPIEPLWFVEGPGKAFVDLQLDVCRTDIELAAREGYQSVEHLKRYTTLGMGTDQGKTSNVNAIANLARALDKPIEAVGTTGFRPPYTPVTLAALAGPFRGAHWKPSQQSPLQGWLVEQGSEFIQAGLWMRSQYFPRPGESMQRAINREVQAVRNSVGICDGSTLGKIEIQGPDAITLINLIYSNSFTKLPIGKARYGLMLREDGIVFDDGTVSRLDENHYFVTTTSAEADQVLSHIEHCHQVLWPELDVSITSVTEQWAVMAIAGPKSRDTVQKIVDDLDLSNEAFPFLAAKEITVLGGIPARLFRISFSGELAYEVFVPARAGEAIAHALMEAGEEFDITPYGVEALDVMRIEKGHVSSEITGTTTANDIGLGGMLSTKKDYIGRVLSQRPGLLDPDREVVVGLRVFNTSHRISNALHITDQGATITPENDLGYITSGTWSPTFGTSIAIALMKRGRERYGDIIDIVDPLTTTQTIAAEVVPHEFYDPENLRVKS